MTPIPGPILLLGLPLLAALVAYLVRPWALLAALVSATTSAGLAILCLILPLDRSAFVLGQEVAFGRPVVIVGRNLVLDPAGKLWLAFAFALAAILYVVAWRTQPGRSFFPFSLVMLSAYALIALVQPFSLAVLVLAMSATPAVFILSAEVDSRQAGRSGSTRGAQRYLVVTLLAVPLLLVAAWVIDHTSASFPGLGAGTGSAGQLLDPSRHPLLLDGGTELGDFLDRAGNIVIAVSAALGFGLLLAVFPFGTWMPAVASDAPPIASAFLFTIGQAMALMLALVFLRDATWLLENAAALEVIQISGLVMVASGGLMAAVQRDLARLFGYAVLSDLGYLLLALGAAGSQSLTLALLHMTNRSLPIILFAASLAVVRHRLSLSEARPGRPDAFASLGGMARRLPVATIGLLTGGLALAGFPLTAGFPIHWAITRAVAVQEPTWAIVLLASSAAIAVGLLRALRGMLGDGMPAAHEAPGRVAGQPVIATLLTLILLAGVIGLGLYPSLLLEPVQAAVAAIGLF